MGIKILRRGLPCVGRLKLGEAGKPRDDGKQAAPLKHDHFELTGLERDEYGRFCPDVELMRDLIESGVPTCGGCERSKVLAEAFEIPELAGGLPTAVKVLLPYDDPEINFPNRLVWHRGRTEFCHGDGEEAERREVLSDQKFGEFKPHGPCGNLCPDFLERCKPKARLRFILAHQANVGGVYEFRTTSWGSIANIAEAIAMIRQMTGGVLQWIPLTLSVVPQTVQPRSGGRAQTAWIARLVYDGNPLELLESVQQNLKLRAPLLAEIRQLEASIKRDDWIEEEIDEFRAEFDHEGLRAEGVIDIAPEEPRSERETEPASAPEDPAESEPASEPPADLKPPQGKELEPPATITKDHQLKLWKLCQERAKRLSQHAKRDIKPEDILRGVLSEMGLKTSADMPVEKLDEALRLATNAKVPSA